MQPDLVVSSRVGMWLVRPRCPPIFILIGYVFKNTIKILHV